MNERVERDATESLRTALARQGYLEPRRVADQPPKTDWREVEYLRLQLQFERLETQSWVMLSAGVLFALGIGFGLGYLVGRVGH